MNIFAVDEDPVVAAQALCDQHVSKMILESAQMLSYVAVRYNHPSLYKASGPHKKHPCTIWAGNNKANWKWLVEHAIALEKEKIYRTGKGHISTEIVKYYLENDYGPPNDSYNLEPFALAMPDKYHQYDRVAAYRSFYLEEKQFFKKGQRPKWTKREPPVWWKYQSNNLFDFNKVIVSRSIVNKLKIQIKI